MWGGWYSRDSKHYAIKASQATSRFDVASETTLNEIELILGLI
jgi:hypothetical protein